MLRLTAFWFKLSQACPPTKSPNGSTRPHWSVALHESIWAYPIIESVHVLTLCLFLGMAILLDLRLLGVTLKRVPVSEVAGRLLPWTVAGFIVMVITGVLLFYGIPLRTYTNIFFRIKVAFLILAGINVWVFHSGIWLKVAEWDRDLIPPPRRPHRWRLFPVPVGRHRSRRPLHRL